MVGVFLDGTSPPMAKGPEIRAGWRLDQAGRPLPRVADGEQAERRRDHPGEQPAHEEQPTMDTIAIREETRTLGRELRRAIPDTYRAFGQRTAPRSRRVR